MPNHYNPDGLLKTICAFGLFAALAAQSQQIPARANQRQAAIGFEEEGRVTDAEAAWKAVAAANPRNAEAFAHLGVLEARQEHYKDAIADYRKALAIDPQFPNLRINLGLSYFKAGDLKEAIQTYEPMLREIPPSSPLRPRLVAITGLAYYGLGNYSGAVPFLKEAVAADPQNLEFRLMFAHSCLWSKQYQCVLDEYKQILTINPNAGEAYMLAGEAYDELKDDTHAVEQFKAAVNADPKTPNVHFGYGYLLWRLMRLEEAATEFRAELANNPDHAMALAYLGDVEVRLQHNDQAAPYLEHSIQIDPSFALAHLDLGIIYESENKKDDAVREYKLASKLKPSDQTVHWRLGRLYQSMGRTDEAKAEIDKTRNLQKVEDEPLIDKINRKAPQPSKP